MNFLYYLTTIIFLISETTYCSSFRDKTVSQIITPNDVKILKEALKPDPLRDTIRAARKIKVGILGAGISGLYSAILLESLGIDFELIEANSEHLGGRAFTYHFNKDYKSAKTCAEFYDYGEMGPMRIPKTVARLVGDQSWSLVNY